MTVEFLVRDSVDDDIGHARLRKAVIDDADFLGGIKYTHEVRRRVLLADVAYGTSATSNHLGLESPSGVPKFALVGTGWVSGELDPGDVFAPDVIAVALLLFDDVWLPIGCLGVVIQAFGVEATLILLNSERFTFFVSREILCFLGDEGGVGGAAKAILQKEGDDFVPLRTENMLAPLVNVVGLRSEVSSAVIRRTRVVPPEVIERVLARTRADIAEHRLRDFVGLPPTITENQAWVDAIVVNRLAHLNFGLLAAEHFRCDVVELEGGLSAVASHKLYYHEGFHRLYPTFGAFDKILRSAGLPDARAVMRLIPVTERVSIANSRAAEDFRNWFWILGAPIIAAGGNLDEEITKRMVHIVGDKVPPAQELIARLRLRFLSFGNGMGALGGFRSSPSPGIASRAKAALRQLEIQKRAHSERRRKLIVDRYGRLPGPYDRCVCGLPAKFKFCCGRSA